MSEDIKRAEDIQRTHDTKRSESVVELLEAGEAKRLLESSQVLDIDSLPLPSLPSRSASDIPIEEPLLLSFKSF